jgi:hypothetical protein
MVISRKIKSVLAGIMFVSLAVLVGCGGMTKMVSAATKLGQESKQLQKMSLADVEKLVSADVDVTRIKRDPDGVLGQYVKLRGKANLEGTKDFPLQKGKIKVNGTGNNDEGGVLLLDDAIFVIVLEPMNGSGIKTGDEVEILGLVSESRFLKATSEIYPQEKIPDYVTVIAKTIKKVIPPAETVTTPSDAAGNTGAVPPVKKPAPTAPPKGKGK